MRTSALIMVLVVLPGCVSLSKQGGTPPGSQSARPQPASGIQDTSSIDQQAGVAAAMDDLTGLAFNNAAATAVASSNGVPVSSSPPSEDGSTVDQQGVANVAIDDVTGIGFTYNQGLQLTLAVLLAIIVLSMEALMAWLMFLSHRREMLRIHNSRSG